MYHMKRASIRDLRYRFPEVERMLRKGEKIEITKRRRVIARLTPVNIRQPERPDFLARLRSIYGRKVLRPSTAELLAQERDRF